ncbi:MAG: hypothetical protein EA376_12810 [Phycisphaeraceae bacterium]|nr:MAG: hypothetical protein EA376_12810 [Phycisphaeraceae bacterium]
MGAGIGIVSLLVLVIAVLAIINVLQSSKPTEMKALWVIVIIVFPLVGAIVYFLVGRE